MNNKTSEYIAMKFENDHLPWCLFGQRIMKQNIDYLRKTGSYVYKNIFTYKNSESNILATVLEKAVWVDFLEEDCSKFSSGEKLQLGILHIFKLRSPFLTISWIVTIPRGITATSLQK